jgi:hypothetical protein
MSKLSSKLLTIERGSTTQVLPAGKEDLVPAKLTDYVFTRYAS